jgi:hypothetical protein
MDRETSDKKAEGCEEGGAQNVQNPCLGNAMRNRLIQQAPSFSKEIPFPSIEMKIKMSKR